MNYAIQNLNRFSDLELNPNLVEVLISEPGPTKSLDRPDPSASAQETQYSPKIRR
jgi:hypothetical protein